jgi:ABC-2 type transport system ATP-binding protein
MTPLSIEHFTKRYGSRLAVDDLNIEIAEGTVFGLIGRNGAGKSTTIACALGLTHFSNGRISIFGAPLSPRSFHRLAYVPEINVLDGWMTAREHAAFRRSMFPQFDADAMREEVERFEIDPSRAIRKLSKGQRQAVALALAFAQRPDLMILDEPSSGLDPVLQRRLLDAVVSRAADGVTIVFSSHQIGQVEQAAERVGILDRGRLLLEADVDDLRERRYLLEAVERDGEVTRVYANGDADEVERGLRATHPLSVERREMTLEEIFFQTIGLEKEYRK